MPDKEGMQPFLKTQGRHVRKDVFLSAFYACASAVLMIGGAWCLAVIVHGAAFLGWGTGEAKTYLVLLIACYVMRAALHYYSEKAAFTAAAKVKADIRFRLLDALLRQGAPLTENGRTGAAVNAFIEGVEGLHNYYARTMPSRITAAFIPLALFCVVMPADWVSALILFLSAPLIPVFMIWIGRGTERLNHRQWRRMAHMSGHFLDRVQGLQTIKLMNAGMREARLVGIICEKFRADTMNVLKIAFLSSLALEFFATVSIAMVAVMIGFRLLWGEMGFLEGFFILLLAPEFYLPLRKMGTHYHAKMEAVAAAEKIGELLSTRDNSPYLPLGKSVFASKSVEIRFVDVSFSYNGTPLLQNVDFTVQAGECVALAGPSGCGKSTILKLLLGFLEPDTGRIMINGMPLSMYDRQSWWDSLSWMPQRAHLFTGTVESNIRLSRMDAGERELADLAAVCAIGDLLHRRTGEHLAGLSGGEAQRVALVRALMRPAPLLLMDEPTAHLDPVTERIVHDAIASHAHGRTVLFAAHREMSLQSADRILWVEKGRVVQKKELVA